jgi:hypothetical protein
MNQLFVVHRVKPIFSWHTITVMAWKMDQRVGRMQCVKAGIAVVPMFYLE